MSPYRARLRDVLLAHVSKRDTDDTGIVDLDAAVAALEQLFREILNEVVADVYRERAE
jgi:hypothetical protein